MSRWQTKYWILLIPVLCLTACSGSRDLTSSSSNDLTRPRALELIRQAEKKGIASEGTIGTPVSAWVEMGPWQGPLSFGKRELNKVGKDRVFQGMGLVEVRPGNCPYDCYEIVLTAKGRSLAIKDSDGDTVFVTALGRDITAVTGVAKQGENEATADFTWKWRLTPVGEAFARAGLLVNGAPMQYIGGNPGYEYQGSGQAALRLYDDGWRVEQVEFQ